jgi:CrcB protein
MIWVFLGGGLGSMARYGFGQLFMKSQLSLPIATLCSNVSSCLIFSFALIYFIPKNGFPVSMRFFILTGICGGLSTFSSFSFETFELFKQQNYTWAILNILLSNVLCILIFYIFNKINLQ